MEKDSEKILITPTENFTSMPSGIYKLENKITGDFYVGSAVNLHRRFTKHGHTLRSQTHKNPILQNVYNKYGPENLLFKIIEIVTDVDRLIEIEQFYIDNLTPKYNICRVAASSLGVKRSEITKEKIRKANLGKHLSEEHKRKVSENNAKFWLGKHRTLVTKVKIAKNNAKPFILIDPFKKVVIGENLHKFCMDNKLDHSAVYKVLKGIYHSHKGWTKAQ